MKRIIYTAVALIICASVFGIADYLNAKKKGALVNYTDDVQTSEAIIPEKKPLITTIGKDEITPKKELKEELKPEKKIAKAKLKDTHFTDIIPNLAVTEKTKEPAMDKIDPINLLLSNAGDQKEDSTIQVDNKRKISLELFSRAPIRQKRIKH